MAAIRRSPLLAAAVAVALLVWIAALLPVRPQLLVTFLDVGDGLCAVARTPSGKIIVVDCGTSSWRNSKAVGDRLAARYIQSLGADWIDVAVLTHPHSDHVSGYASLIAVKPARLVLDIGVEHASPFYEDFLNQVEACGADYRIARRGQRVDLGDGAVLEVLSPSEDRDYSNLNDRSAVIRLDFGSVSVMFMGDAGEDAELDILRSNLHVRSQVLQVGHHGSSGASSVAWLQAVAPRIAVISTARNSRYGHPSQETLSRLEAAGARVFVTGRDGALTVVSDGSNLEVRAAARRQTASR